MTGEPTPTDIDPQTLRAALDAPPSGARSTEAAGVLEAAGFDDAGRALANLRRLRDNCPGDEFDALLAPLLGSIGRCPDADMALNNVDRVLSACPDRSSLLDVWLGERRCLDVVVQLCATSQLLADILRETGLVHCRGIAGSPHPPRRLADEMQAEAEEAVREPGGLAARLDALRRFKRRELLRVASRDILRAASFGELVEEISDLAGACIRVTLELCWEISPPPELPSGLDAPEEWWREFAVVAMGKLGARELNYSSDVDLLFVCDTSWAPEGSAPEPVRRYFDRLGKTLIDALAGLTADRGLFRVDMRLRPEGGAGALVRALEGCVTYYESWAAVWERQALIKASWIAGSRSLGDRFVRMAREFVYGKRLDTAGVAEIKAVKNRIEASVRRPGGALNVKLDPGCIRDIEFTVQFLQLVFGTQDETIRKRSTLGALRALGAAKYISATEHKTLASGYVFLRTIEHQLQLMHGLSVRELPTDPAALDKLARRLDFPDSALTAPGEFLLAEFRRHTADARELFRKLFAEMYEVRDEADMRARSLVLLPADPDGADAAALSEYGIHDVERAAAVLRRLAHGTVAAPLPASAAEHFADLTPRVLRAAARTPDPDASLVNFERFCGLIGSHGALYSVLAGEPMVVDMLVRVAGCSASLSGILVAHPEYFDMLMDPGLMTAVRSEEKLAGELAVRLEDVADPAARLQAVSRFRRRELLRVGVRDLMGDADVETTICELSAIGEVCLAAILDVVGRQLARRPAEQLPFAIIGMGKLAGRELHYNSDLDVMFVWGEGGDPIPDRQALYTRLAGEILSGAGQGAAGEGPPLTVDARLRPEGQSGPLARSVESCRGYYARRAATWERMALIRSRLVAGDARVADEFAEAVHDFLWGRGLSAEELGDVIHVKGRIEHERARTEGGVVDVKLGAGGINDVEFCVQILQLAHGHEDRSVRVPGTLGGIRALSRAGRFFSDDDAEHLEAAYLFLRRVECRLQIVHAWDESTIEPGTGGFERLARLLEYDDHAPPSAPERLAEDLNTHRERVRAIFERTVARLREPC